MTEDEEFEALEQRLNYKHKEQAMNREDIIRMALEAGFCHDINNGIYLCAPMHIERFAALVAAAEQAKFSADLIEYGKAMAAVEREACAKVCDSHALAEGVPGAPTWSEACAAAIRARSKQ